MIFSLSSRAFLKASAIWRIFASLYNQLTNHRLYDLLILLPPTRIIDNASVLNNVLTVFQGSFTLPDSNHHTYCLGIQTTIARSWVRQLFVYISSEKTLLFSFRFFEIYESIFFLLFSKLFNDSMLLMCKFSGVKRISALIIASRRSDSLELKYWRISWHCWVQRYLR